MDSKPGCPIGNGTPGVERPLSALASTSTVDLLSFVPFDPSVVERVQTTTRIVVKKEISNITTIVIIVMIVIL